MPKTQKMLRLSHLHDKHVVIPADKAPNNIVFVCRSHNIVDRLIKKFANSIGNPTYTPMTLTKEEILTSQVCDVFLWNNTQSQRVFD